MQYRNIVKGIFLERQNRFIAKVEINGKAETVHVKNTGRCKELLRPGTTVYLEPGTNPLRRTRCDLVAVEKIRDGKVPLAINMDSQVPNAAAAEWLPCSGLFSPGAHIRREVTFGDSRFDLYVEDGPRRCFMEVKGVTLEQNGIALFPDAPTLRGVKHLKELVRCKAAGYEAFLLFVIQMKEIRRFSPNDAMHPEFGAALREAAAAGVRLLAMDCRITPDSITIADPVPIEL